MANIEFNYAKVDYTLNTAAQTALGKEIAPTQTRVVVSTKAGIADVAVGIVKAGSDGANVTLGDPDAKANFKMEAFNASALTDTTAFYVGVKAPVGPVKVGLEYGTTSDINGKVAGDTKFSETKLSVAYAMSKNFTISGFITNDSSDNATLDKADKNRIEIKYTF